MATKKTTKKAAKKGTKSQSSRANTYRFDSKGRIIGPDGKKVALDAADTPIVISGGSLRILSTADLDDEDNQGQRTKQLQSSDMSKHVSSIQLLGFTAVAGNPGRFAPTNPNNPACTIIIHYE